MNNWVIYNKKANFNEIAGRFGISPLTARVLCNRDIVDDEDIRKILSDNLELLNDENLLQDLDEAVLFLKKEIENKSKIRIVGDYDVDGVCSTFILYDALKSLGATVDYIVPDRINDGYGINISIIENAIKDKVKTIITCDNGIAANKEIDFAREHNLNVIVTDHHDIQEIPKSANFVIDPKRKDKEKIYPFTEICGTVVAWKFIKKLFETYEDKTSYKKYLEFACIATICDVMPIINENHIIVKVGLSHIKETENIGLKTLIDISNLQNKDIGIYHIGFIIGPMINASGRLKSAMKALELFNEKDKEKVFELAKELKDLNEERKAQTDFAEKKGLEEIEKNFKDDKVYVIYIEDVHESIAGIVAGRIKEDKMKPTIVLTDTINKEVLKASGRSIDNYDMFKELCKCKDLFIKFGGHKLAAGFSLKREKLETLRSFLNENTTLTEKDFKKKIYIDSILPLKYINIDLINDLEKLKPFGNMMEKPTFALKDISFRVVNVYGEKRNVIKLEISAEETKMFATLFENIDIFNEKTKDIKTIDILFNLSINEFNNYKNIEITIKEYRLKSL